MTFSHRLAEKLMHELRRHPQDRSVGGHYGWYALNEAAGQQIEALEGMERTPAQEELLSGLLAAMMMPDELKKTERQKAQEKRWSKLSKIAGHPIGDCFDGSDLCSVCARG